MNIEQTIIGNLLLADTVEKQKTLSSRLLSEFFTGVNQKIIQKIKDENKENRIVDSKFMNLDDLENSQEYLLGCIAQSVHYTKEKEMLHHLKEDYLLRTTQNIADLKDFRLAKAKILEAEEKAQILDETTPRTIQEVVESSLTSSTQNLNKLTKTGFSNFDSSFGGFSEGQLCTIGGYSGIGKSTFLFSLVKNLSQNNQTLIFNLEMDNYTMSARILSSLSGLSFIDCMSLGNPETQEKIAKYSSDKYAIGSQKMENLNLKMVDNQFELAQICTTIRKEKTKNNLKFVLVDYLQLIKTNSTKPRHIEIGEITRELKLLAKELKITIIILAQLGRASLTREEPEIQDLRESGSIEQDSDLVFLIYKNSKNERWLKLAKDRMFGFFVKESLSYNPSTQSYE
jgi:replicative DNA helicase